MDNNTRSATEFNPNTYRLALDAEPLHDRARELLGALADHADHTGTVRGVSTLKIAAETGMLPQSIFKSFKRLEHRGYMTIQPARWPGTPNSYQLHIPAGDGQ